MSRASILKRLKKNKPPSVELPVIPKFGKKSDQLETTFIKNAQASGTTCITAESTIESIIQNHHSGAKHIAAPEYPSIATLKLSATTSIAQLEQLDLVVLKASLGVAENGAVWLPEKLGIPRVVPFITQHLLIVLSPQHIVWDMHEAYQQLSFASLGFGVFIAGPSKTADIEQSLVIGAQGARSMGVWLKSASQE